MDKDVILWAVGIVSSILLTGMGTLIIIIHKQGMNMLKDIKQGVDRVGQKTDNHETRLSKVESTLEAKANVCEKQHEECEEDRKALHGRVTRAQGGV